MPEDNNLNDISLSPLTVDVCGNTYVGSNVNVAELNVDGSCKNDNCTYADQDFSLTWDQT